MKLLKMQQLDDDEEELAYSTTTNKGGAGMVTTTFYSLALHTHLGRDEIDSDLSVYMESTGATRTPSSRASKRDPT